MAESKGESGWGRALARHPRLVAWAALSIGMVAILLVSARGAGLLILQELALVAVTIGLAGLCVWIIGWE